MLSKKVKSRIFFLIFSLVFFALVIFFILRSLEEFESKFSAATLADVLVDIPASLPFDDLINHVLNQLNVLKEDTICSKGWFFSGVFSKKNIFFLPDVKKLELKAEFTCLLNRSVMT